MAGSLALYLRGLHRPPKDYRTPNNCRTHISRTRTEVQASRTWQPPTGTLGKILEETRRTLPSLIGGVGHLAVGADAAIASMRTALLRDDVAVIGEIKRRSPSKGDLNVDMNAADHAAALERGGAAAISVLTETSFFGGTAADLRAARAATRIPILKKDFHVHEAQLRQAKELGASAVLLIARALAPDELPTLVAAARRIGLESVV